MKTKSFRKGASSQCKSYLKNAGKGYEVGFVFGGRPVFVGNFISSKEANGWYSQLNKEVRKFSKQYRVGKNCPKTWYGKFLSHHLYRRYYNYVGKLVPSHGRTYQTAVNRDVRQYKRLNRRWPTKTKQAFLRAA